MFLVILSHSDILVNFSCSLLAKSNGEQELMYFETYEV